MKTIIKALFSFVLFTFAATAQTDETSSNPQINSYSEIKNETSKTTQLYEQLSLAMADETEAMLSELCNAHGASGFEGPVRNILKKYWNEQGVAFEVDKMGNLIGTFSSNNEGPTVLIMAHMDEVGFMIKKIHEDGFISVIPLGGWADSVLWVHKWNIQIEDQSLMAISGMDSPHIFWKDNPHPVVTQSQFFLDTGLSKQALEEMGARPGMPITPDAKFAVLKPKERYIGKAFDDRAGLSVMIDLMKALAKRKNIKCRVVFAATVQEELGMRGAQTIYESLKPDIVLNLEAGIARDYPSQFASEKEPVLGKGPTVFIYDASMMPNQNLITAIAKIAQKNQLPIQWESELCYGQDASCLQGAGYGVPAANIGIPVRYAHSHYGVMDRSDYDNTVKLLLSIIENTNFSFLKELP